MQHRFAAVLAALALVTAAGCGARGDSSTALPQTQSASRTPQTIAPGTVFTGRRPENSLGGIPLFSVSLSLFDAPLSLGADDHVYLGLTGVNLAKGNTVTPLYSFPFPVIVDLLALQRLGIQFTSSVNVGDYDSVQLVVVPAFSNVVAAGVTYPIALADGKHLDFTPTPVVAKVHVKGSAGDSVGVAVDFNALESFTIVNGIAEIHPELVAAVSPAQVHGTVVNANGQPVSNAAVVVSKGNAYVNSGLTDASGNFVVHALDAGDYTVSVVNAYTSKSGISVTAHNADAGAAPSAKAKVAAGADLDLGTIQD